MNKKLFLIGCLAINVLQLAILYVMNIYFNNALQIAMIWVLIYMSGLIVGYGLHIASIINKKKELPT